MLQVLPINGKPRGASSVIALALAAFAIWRPSLPAYLAAAGANMVAVWFFWPGYLFVRPNHLAAHLRNIEPQGPCDGRLSPRTLILAPLKSASDVIACDADVIEHLIW